MFIKNIRNVLQTFSNGFKEVAAQTKPTLYKKVWASTELGTKLTQRPISSPFASNIKTLTTIAGGVGLMMVATPSEEHASQLVSHAMQKILCWPLHPMSNPSVETITTIQTYLRDQFTIALKDPSTFLHGCQIEVSWDKVTTHLNREVSCQIPEFHVIVKAETISAVLNGKENTSPIVVHEPGILN